MINPKESKTPEKMLFIGLSPCWEKNGNTELFGEIESESRRTSLINRPSPGNKPGMPRNPGNRIPETEIGKLNL